MSIYSCHIRNIQRSAGESTTAKLSYISGEKVYDEHTGLTKDCRHGKGGVVFTNTILPEGAPEKYKDPRVLVNEFEMYEKQANARLGKSIMVALPRNCSLEENISAVEDFIQSYFTTNRLPATYAIHDSGDGNPHAHILVVARSLDKNGNWAKAKEKKVPELDENGNKIPLIDPKTGEQKVRVRKGKGTEKLWKTKTVVHDPLNGRANYKSIRKAWENSVNKHLAPEQQVDCRSYKERGLDIEPTKHEGYTARKRAAEGQYVDVIAENKRIMERRMEMKAIDEKISELDQSIAESENKIATWQEELTSRVKNVFAWLRENVVDPVRETVSSFRRSEHFYHLTNHLQQDLLVFKYTNDTIECLNNTTDEMTAGKLILESDDHALEYLEDMTGYPVDIMDDERADYYRPIFEEWEAENSTVTDNIILSGSNPYHGRER